MFSAPRRQLHAKARRRISTLTVFYGRGWIARAAHLKKPRRGFFPAGLFGGSMLFESTHLASGKVITKQKLQYPVRILEFLVSAGGLRKPRC